jgi:hypothetical protein
LRTRTADRRRGALRAGLAVWLALGPAALAAAHRTMPAGAAAEIAAGALAEELGVVAAHPHPGLPRLLEIEVDERWHAAAAERRLRAAEAWRALWRAATPGGLIAVTDGGGASLVGFDAEGRPALAKPAELDAQPSDRRPSPR